MVISLATFSMDTIANVDIDPSGKYKYILVKVTEKGTKNSKLVVRGYSRCAFHADILDEITPGVEKQNCSAKCLGGGRIFHEPDRKVLKVYSYSQGFGKADHSETVEILKKVYTDYDISWTDDE